MRGSLRAASITRWFSVFMLTGFITFLFAWPFMQPIGLSLTQIRLSPGTTLFASAIMVIVMLILSWLTKELGSEPIQIARANAGKKKRNMYIPAGIGFSFVVVLAIFVIILIGGKTAEHAKSIARKELGSNYHFHVSNLNIATSSKGTYVNAIVTAWNDNEIINLPVEWNELKKMLTRRST